MPPIQPDSLKERPREAAPPDIWGCIVQREGARFLRHHAGTVGLNCYDESESEHAGEYVTMFTGNMGGLTSLHWPPICAAMGAGSNICRGFGVVALLF